MHCQFLNRKKFYSMLLQGMCNSEWLSEMSAQNNLVEYIMLVNLRGVKCIRRSWDERLYLNQFRESVELKFHHTCLEILFILAVHIY